MYAHTVQSTSSIYERPTSFNHGRKTRTELNFSKRGGAPRLAIVCMTRRPGVPTRCFIGMTLDRECVAQQRNKLREGNWKETADRPSPSTTQIPQNKPHVTLL